MRRKKTVKIHIIKPPPPKKKLIKCRFWTSVEGILKKSRVSMYFFRYNLTKQILMANFNQTISFGMKKTTHIFKGEENRTG